MDQFPISSLARLSGIQPHTIRMWEKRYNALQPNRSEGNTRYYSGSQLRRLLNIVSLLGQGHKLPELCALSDKRLFRLVEDTIQSAERTQDEYFVTQLIAAGMSYDESSFTAVFAHCLTRYGFKDTYTRIVYPTLSRMGLLWAGDILSPSHEHFISNLLRQKLCTAIDALPPAGSEQEGWMLFLPENEFHEIGLLFAHYLLRVAGRRTCYLGANVPAAALDAAVRNTSPVCLLLFIVRHDLPENLQSYLDGLKNSFPGKRIYIAAPPLLREGVKTGNSVQWLESVEQLLQYASLKTV